MRLLDLLWVMADDRSPYRPRIRATAAESILPVTGLRGLKGHRALTLKRCVENVKEGRAVVTSLKVRHKRDERQETFALENVAREGGILKSISWSRLAKFLERDDCAEKYSVRGRNFDKYLLVEIGKVFGKRRLRWKT